MVLIVKKPPANAGGIKRCGFIPGWEDALEESMATYFNTVDWRIPMDRGAWWAIHRVTTSGIGLKQQHTHHQE